MHCRESIRVIAFAEKFFSQDNLDILKIRLQIGFSLIRDFGRRCPNIGNILYQRQHMFDNLLRRRHMPAGQRALARMTDSSRENGFLLNIQFNGLCVWFINERDSHGSLHDHLRRPMREKEKCTEHIFIGLYSSVISLEQINIY